VTEEEKRAARRRLIGGVLIESTEFVRDNAKFVPYFSEKK